MTYRRALYAVLAIALLACAYVALVRWEKEAASKRVELTMDYGDFISLARSYNYDPAAFLVALRRAGLTSLAVSEELGANLNNAPNVTAVSGPSLLQQARISAPTSPTIASLVRAGAIRPDEVYLITSDPASYARYQRQLRIHLGPKAVRVLSTRAPYVIAVRTQADFFAQTALGIPREQIDLTRLLALRMDPRVQNDERFDATQIDAIVNGFLHGPHIGTVIFFGQRNQVLGFPNNLDETADAFRAHHLIFGAIEVYDKNQAQKGTEGLAKLIPGLTTRVEAISKPELDRLDPETIIARYLLGVRERNIRVVYLRPFLHEWDDRSILSTNVELVRRIADGLRARGFTLGRATPVPAFRINPLVIIVATLAVPAILLVILDLLGIRRRELAIAIFALDLLAIGGGYAVHHDMIARKLIALLGAILFPVAGSLAIAPLFSTPSPRSLGEAFGAGFRSLAIATAVALGGALVVVGLLSTPLLMEEIDRFTGVKAVLTVPPLAILALYLFTNAFGRRASDARGLFNEPVRLWQLGIGVVLIGAAFVLVARSGNTSDVTPSSFELLLRSNLTAWLSVRPRFKEFLVGFPLLMLLPSLVLADKRRIGWLVALGIGVGLGDLVDTFSHLHTHLAISLLRVVNGAVLGAIVGAIAIVAYRAFRARYPYRETLRTPVEPLSPREVAVRGS